jgi:CRP-like cAMP-binding protein
MAAKPSPEVSLKKRKVQMEPTEPKTRSKGSRFDPKKFLTEAGAGRTIWPYEQNTVIFSQGDAANSLLYIQKGKVKITVLSKVGRRARRLRNRRSAGWVWLARNPESLNHWWFAVE